MIQREAAIAAIRTCKTREALDEMLDRFKLSSIQETIDVLTECMYSPRRFDFDRLTPEEDFDITKQVFLTGVWRLNELYDRQ